MSPLEPRLWWLSFCDPDRPKGKQFLGVALVQPMIDDFLFAVMEARRAGCNPGGEVQGNSWAPVRFCPARFVGRLLTKAEANEAEEIAKAAYDAAHVPASAGAPS